jgi:hypothetical protein
VEEAAVAVSVPVVSAVVSVLVVSVPAVSAVAVSVPVVSAVVGLVSRKVLVSGLLKICPEQF